MQKMPASKRKSKPPSNKPNKTRQLQYICQQRELKRRRKRSVFNNSNMRKYLVSKTHHSALKRDPLRKLHSRMRNLQKLLHQMLPRMDNHKLRIKRSQHRREKATEDATAISFEIRLMSLIDLNNFKNSYQILNAYYSLL